MKSSVFKMINAWFVEYKDADMSYIKSYHNHKDGYGIQDILNIKFQAETAFC